MVHLTNKNKFQIDSIIPKDNFFENDPEHVNRYLFVSEFIKDKIVLDAACGMGYGTKYLSKFAKKVVGVDIDEKYIEFANKKYREEKLEFLTNDVMKINFSNEMFDIVTSFETIEHLTKPEIFLEKISKVLKNNGKLFLSTPNWELSPKDSGKPINKFHVKEYSKKELEEMLLPYFSKVNILGQHLKNKNPELVQDYIKKYNTWNKMPKFLRNIIPNFIKIQLIKLMKLQRYDNPNFSYKDYIVEDFDPSLSLVLFAICENPKNI